MIKNTFGVTSGLWYLAIEGYVRKWRGGGGEEKGGWRKWEGRERRKRGVKGRKTGRGEGGRGDNDRGREQRRGRRNNRLEEWDRVGKVGGRGRGIG